MVAIVTDSTADLPADRARRLGVHVVPLVVRIDEASYEDGVELSPEAFYQKLHGARSIPTTSQPAVGRFKAVYEGIEADEIISIHISGGLSGTVNGAKAAAEQVRGKRIQVIDSQTVSLALGFMVQRAGEAASAGEGFEAIGTMVEASLTKTGFYAVLDSLQHAQRSGRLGAAQALLGSILQIKPIITLRDGLVQAIDRPRTMRKALDRIVETLSDEAPFAHLAVPHAANGPLAEDLASRLAAMAPGAIDVVTTGAVVGSHCGPGAVAACYLK